LKKYLKGISFLLFLLFASYSSFSQQINPDFLTKNWNARWITAPESNPTDYGVYVFRKKFDIAAQPSNYIIHVSADNKYRLYVNGQFIGVGPARNDVEHWFFDTYDIAKHLKPGSNTIAAKVWNEGAGKAEAQISLRTGFILDGEGEASAIATNDTWKAAQDGSYSPLRVRVYGYYAAGPGENVEMEKYLKDWQSPDFDDSNWSRKNTSNSKIRGIGSQWSFWFEADYRRGKLQGNPSFGSILPDQRLSNLQIQ